MDSDTTIHLTSNSRRLVFVAGLAWLLSYLAARFTLQAIAPAPHWDIVVANVPVIAFFWFVWVVRRALKDTDELRRRIHLEALALAFPTVMLVLMTLGLLDSPPVGPPLGIPLRDLWVVLPPIYGICFIVVNQRYR
jgi:hypothetical protein